jgi:hypothetical protein
VTCKVCGRQGLTQYRIDLFFLLAEAVCEPLCARCTGWLSKLKGGWKGESCRG